jgi:hypothetical protein
MEEDEKEEEANLFSPSREDRQGKIFASRA